MAHDINFANGRYSVFTVGELPWHKLGQNVQEAQTWQDAMRLAGLQWQVLKESLTSPYDGTQLPVYGMFRDDNHAFLGVVRDRYTPIQNRFAFDFVDALVDSGGAHYESAGALRNGERIWCLARLPQEIEVVPGDKHFQYLLFATSHDGSLSAQAKLTDVRPVCANTLSIALTSTGACLKIKHTESAFEKLEYAKQFLAHTVKSSKDIETKLRTLADRRLTRESAQTIFERLFPAPDNGEISTRSKNILAEILERYESNDDNAFPSIRGTAYNLLNAVTEYTDHSRTSRVTKSQTGDSVKARAEAAMFGSGDALKTLALEVILQETNGAPSRNHTVYSMPVVDDYFDRLSKVIDLTPRSA